MRTFQEAWASYRTQQSRALVYRGGVRLCRPDTLSRNATRYVEQLKHDSEAFRRLPTAEHQRVTRDRVQELQPVFRRATQWAREQTREARTEAANYADLVRRTRRDTGLSFPDVVQKLSADGRATLALLRVQVRQAFAGVGAGRLHDIYGDAFGRKDDVLALAECGAVEDLIAADTRFVLPADVDEKDHSAVLSEIKQLRTLVTDVQDLRLPSECPDFDGLVKELSSLDHRASRLGVPPLSVPAPVHEDPALVAELTAEGELTEAAWTKANVQTEAASA